MEYSYYGRCDKKKHKIGVSDTMLDDHIKNILDKQTRRFQKECSEMIKQLKEDSFSEILSLSKKIKQLQLEIKSLKKHD